MSSLAMIVLASLAEGIVSFSGAALAIFEENKVRRFAHFIVSFAVGALLGVAFLDLIPEAIEMAGKADIFPFVLGGVIGFFILEKFLFWYHCHEDGSCPVHTYNYLILWGDFLHNFIDGVIISLAFLVDRELGFLTSIAVILHEIPQEISDFTILIHGGFSRRKAMIYNFFVSLATILGAVLTYIFGNALEELLPFAIAIVAGNFIYLAASDLMPELHESTGIRHGIFQVVFIIAGVLLIAAPGFFFEH